MHNFGAYFYQKILWRWFYFIWNNYKHLLNSRAQRCKTQSLWVIDYLGTVEHCWRGTVLHCWRGIELHSCFSCCFGTLVHCCLGTSLHCCLGTLVHCSRGTVEHCCLGILWHCCLGTCLGTCNKIHYWAENYLISNSFTFYLFQWLDW